MTRTVNSIRIRSRNKTVGKKVEESSSLVYYGYLTGIWRERQRETISIYIYVRSNKFIWPGEEGIRVRFNKFVNVSRFSSPW